jgi:hypothetical protein
VTGRRSRNVWGRSSIHAALMVSVLGIVAVVAPVPSESDRAFYEHNRGRWVIPDCEGGDCFRPLVAAVLERLPGPSVVKWKTYAVLANTIGAVAVGRFCLLLGLSSTAGFAAMWLSALGTGSLYAVYDCFTSDSLMYMLGPLMAIGLWRGRYMRTGAVGAVGVFAKEFAAAPLWIFTVFAALERRWNAALRLFITSSAVTLVWLAMHASFIVLHNYRYGATTSADLLHGGYLSTWLGSMRLTGALTYLFTSFGALYLLWPVGFVRGSRRIRLLALAALPALAAFVYVEQPERALWNFHFIVVPLAAVCLQESPDWIVALFVACFGIANLRLGAQLPIRGAARVALLLSMVLGAVVATRAWFQFRTATNPARPVDMNAPVSALRSSTVIVFQGMLLASLLMSLFDVSVHRRPGVHFGVNQWGYRGSLAVAPHAGLRIAMVGGTAAFAARAPLADTVAAQLATEVNARQRWTGSGGPYANVDNIAEPGAGAASYVAALRDYAYLHPDIVCIYDGYESVSSPGALGRHRSIVFRLTGYLPRSPVRLLRGIESRVDVDPAPPFLDNRQNTTIDPSCGAASAAYCAAMVDAVRVALEHAKAVVVATPPYISSAHEVQQRSLGETLLREFKYESRFRYVDLGRTIDLSDRAKSEDGVQPTSLGARMIATRLGDTILELTPQLQ